MPHLRVGTAALGILLATVIDARAQSGSISGRVTVEKGGLRHVVVLLFKIDEDSASQKAVATATTDDEGRYRLDGLAAGHYAVAASAPGYAAALERDMGYYGKQVVLGDGEAVKNVDVALARGGVITGRVTDSDGRAVIGEAVTLTVVGDDGKRRPAALGERVDRRTDDRGVYRIYGLSPGRYLVSVGVAEGDRSGPRFGQAGWYPKTYYPSAASEDGATPVEVTGGSESGGVDLVVVGKRAKTYSAKGRVVDADSGAPIAGARLGYGKIFDGPRGPSVMSQIIVYRSDERGEFTMDGLSPGRYAAIVSGGDADDGSWSWYGDPAPFTISDSNVTGVEVPLHKGVRLDGVVVLEGTTDPALRAKLQLMRVSARTETDEPRLLQDGHTASVQIGPDGAFSLGGVRPGQVTIDVFSWPRQKGFAILRIERDGVEQSGPLMVSAGERVSGLRVVVGYGNGSIRGHVEVVDGALPPKARLWAFVQRVGSPGSEQDTTVDARGQFLVEGLPSGAYEVKVTVYREGGEPTSVTKSVSVTGDAATAVTVEIDPKGEEGDDR